MSGAVDFYFDFVSPMSYIGLARLQDVQARTGCDINFHPFFLGGVMKAAGVQPPPTIPAKAAFIQKDMARHAKRFARPFVFNPAFPMNTRSLLIAATGLEDDERLPAFISFGFSLVWEKAVDVSRPDLLQAAWVDAPIGFDAFEALAGDETHAARLKANTQKAVERGAFGAPTFFVGDEMFFGQDRLDFVEDALTAKNWI